MDGHPHEPEGRERRDPWRGRPWPGVRGRAGSLPTILVAFLLVSAGLAQVPLTPRDAAAAPPPDSPIHARVRDLLADVGPPLTSFSTSPMNPNGDSGWFKGTAPSVTFTARDPEGSDPPIVYYGWEVDPPDSVYSSTRPAPVGDNTLFYRSVDAQGNVEQVRSERFLVDPNASSPVVISPAGTGSSGSSPVSISGLVDFEAMADDALSGVRYVVFFYVARRGDGWEPVGTRIGAEQSVPVAQAAGGGVYRVMWNTVLVPDGEYRLEAQVRDVAGNTAFSLPLVVRVANWRTVVDQADRPWD